MKHQAKSIRPFIGAKNFDLSRSFYRDLGFKENYISTSICYFDLDGFGFYLQNAFVKDWIENTMVFMEVENVNQFWIELLNLGLKTKYSSVKLVPIRELEWGKECFVHDPSGILWHFGEFI
ncbi:glyoxalase [Flavobacterium sp. W22_SRS_FP1]|uniref:glyoxalase n=1 Tax=Flavobacterium sp. W22_SRS_FP1 TaxID=3240276 RepID=UPI003F8DEB5E